jgi:cation-transporting ATPase 13A3/4/5
MENKLKPDTATVIRTLQASGLDLKVISGDNGLTTIQCARECNIID